MQNRTRSVSRELATLRRSLRAMDRSLRRLAPKLLAAANGHGNEKVDRPARKLNLSPKRRAQLKLQGLYIRYIRQLRPQQTAEVRRIRECKGAELAIRKAKELAS